MTIERMPLILRPLITRNVCLPVVKRKRKVRLERREGKIIGYCVQRDECLEIGRCKLQR